MPDHIASLLSRLVLSESKSWASVATPLNVAEHSHTAAGFEHIATPDSVDISGPAKGHDTPFACWEQLGDLIVFTGSSVAPDQEQQHQRALGAQSPPVTLGWLPPPRALLTPRSPRSAV